MTDKKTPTPTADPPKPLSLLEQAMAMQEFEGEVEGRLIENWTLQDIISAFRRRRADAEHQRQIDSQPEPPQPSVKEQAAEVEYEQLARTCIVWPPLTFPTGVSVEEFRKKMKHYPVVIEGEWKQALKKIRRNGDGTVTLLIDPRAPILDVAATLTHVFDEISGAAEQAEKNRKQAERDEREAQRQREAQAWVAPEIPIFG